MSTTSSAVRPGSGLMACSKLSRRSTARCPARRLFRAPATLPGSDGKGVGDVADGLDATLVVEDDGHHVEAARRLAEPLQLQIAQCELAQAVLLARVHRGLGRVALGVAAGLDLDEHEGLALLGDEVDLPGAGADVLVEDRVAAAGEE